MGIHDRDWYRDEMRQREGLGRSSSPSGSGPVRRVEVRRSTYERYRNSQRGGWPTWAIVIFWAFVFGLVLGLFRARPLPRLAPEYMLLGVAFVCVFLLGVLVGRSGSRRRH